MKRSEIRWYTFANPDKKSPVLILTRDSVHDYLTEITAAPITTTIREIPSEVFLSTADGMPCDCAVNCDHLQTGSKGKIGGLITSLSQSEMVKAGWAKRFALDIEDGKGTY